MTKKERVDFSRPVSVSFVVVVRQLQVLPERVLREQRVQLQQRPVRVRARLGRSRYARDILSLSLCRCVSVCRLKIAQRSVDLLVQVATSSAR